MISIVIQSGGKSTRMGTEKGLVPFCGTTLIETVIKRVNSIGEELFIVTNSPDKYFYLNHRVVEDLIKDYGPLAGLQTGLYFANNPIVVNLACDIPLLNLKLLQVMVKQIFEHPEIDVVIPKTELGFEPMQAVYRKETCLKAINHAIASDQRRMISWFSEVNVHPILEPELRKFDPDLISFLNVNSKHDLEQVEMLVGCSEVFK